MNVLECTVCESPLDAASVNSGTWETCDHCRTSFRVDVFPAISEVHAQGREPVGLVDATASACAIHESNRAEHICGHCGRYLCALCAIDFRGGAYCADCLEAAAEANQGGVFQTEFTRLDHLARLLAYLPVLAVWPTLVTAPAALAVGVFAWKKVKDPVPHSRLALGAAMAFALLQCVVWAVLIPRFLMFLFSGD